MADRDVGQGPAGHGWPVGSVPRKAREAQGTDSQLHRESAASWGVLPLGYFSLDKLLEVTRAGSAAPRLEDGDPMVRVERLGPRFRYALSGLRLLPHFCFELFNSSQISSAERLK